MFDWLRRIFVPEKVEQVKPSPEPEANKVQINPMPESQPLPTVPVTTIPVKASVVRKEKPAPAPKKRPAAKPAPKVAAKINKARGRPKKNG